MPADHAVPVSACEVTEAQAGEIEHGARLDVDPESTVAIDRHPRGGVHRDRIGRPVDGGRIQPGVRRAPLQAPRAAQGEVLPGDDLGDPVVVQQAGDVEQLSVEPAPP